MKLNYLIILLLNFTQIIAQPLPVLPELTHTFNNARDFTMNKNEAYFSAQSTLGDVSVIIRIERINNKWSKPSIASFSGSHHDIEPFISSNGLKLYFASKRPKSNDSKSTDYDIWYVTRKNNKESWSDPINMGNPINTDKNEFYPSVADNGNLYFTANYEDSKGKDDIYLSEYNHGEYHKPYSLSESINSDGEEYNAYIAKDESYLIFGAYRREDSIGSGDLYISNRSKNNQWSKAKNLGTDVNSKQMDYCPFVDSSILYFTSKRSEYRQTQFNKIDELINSLNSAQNGMSRIYSIELTLQ